MDIAGRLTQINQEILRIDNEKQEREQMLGLLWEHPPALNTEAVGRRMQQIRDRIRALKERKRALLQEQQSLIVEGAEPRGKWKQRGELIRLCGWSMCV
ncbi:conserved hypothetical protein [Ricinus communis]|uniref:Uncharacterized protein n=1 Tax=Ricinus communis TaxID=3988 RepID=B9TAJ6_RICCO|nr:conserved hypothetical protein [Ricinus communis]